MFSLALTIIYLFSYEINAFLPKMSLTKRGRALTMTHYMSPRISEFLLAFEEQAKVVPYERGEMPMWVVPTVISLIVTSIAVPQIVRKLVHIFINILP